MTEDDDFGIDVVEQAEDFTLLELFKMWGAMPYFDPSDKDEPLSVLGYKQSHCVKDGLDALHLTDAVLADLCLHDGERVQRAAKLLRGLCILSIKMQADILPRMSKVTYKNIDPEVWRPVARDVIERMLELDVVLCELRAGVVRRALR